MSLLRLYIGAVLIIGIIAAGHAKDCAHRDYGYGSIVCVCNSTYCDSTTRNVPRKGQYHIYESSLLGKRLSLQTGSFKIKITAKDSVTINLYPKQKFQKIHGFGGAFTGAAGINFAKLSPGAQQNFIESYFGKDGSRYNLGRVPAGSTDFSSRKENYANEEDAELKNFTLTDEDLEYKIPLMKRALEKSPGLKFLSAAWTVPGWMTSNETADSSGFLKKEHYQTYADYLVNYLREYSNRGLKIWAISPGSGAVANPGEPIVDGNDIKWLGKDVGKWITDNLGPAIAASESNDTLILLLDDLRLYLLTHVSAAFATPEVRNYTAGFAVHGYLDYATPSEYLDITNDNYPEKFIIMTEMSTGAFPWDYPKIRLGDWSRGEEYIVNIMNNLNHWVTGYVDWNLALDVKGGPNWSGSYADSPIIIDPIKDEFFKQPSYYAIAHFSKFISRGSSRIGAVATGRIKHVAFLTTENEIVIVLYNDGDQTTTVLVRDPQWGIISTSITPRSIQTIIYRR